MLHTVVTSICHSAAFPLRCVAEMTTCMTDAAGGYACLAGLCFTPDLYAWYALSLLRLTVAHA